MRRFRKKNRADIADNRVRIPAFAGMTKYYSTVVVFYNAVTSVIRLSPSETPDFFTPSFAGTTKRTCEEIEPVYQYSSFPRKRESVAALP